MVIDIFRPDPPGGPWVILIAGEAPRFLQPDAATLAVLEAALGEGEAGRFDADLEGETLQLGQRLPELGRRPSQR